MKAYLIGNETVEVNNGYELVMNLLNRFDSVDSLKEGLNFTKDKKADSDDKYIKSNRHDCWVFTRGDDYDIDAAALANEIGVEFEEVDTEDSRRERLTKRLEMTCNNFYNLLTCQDNKDYAFSTDDLEFASSEFSLIVGPWVHEDDDEEQLRAIARLFMIGKYNTKNAEFFKSYCKLACAAIKYMVKNMSLVRELKVDESVCITDVYMPILCNLAYLIGIKRKDYGMIWYTRLNLVYYVLTEMLKNGAPEEIEELVSYIGDDR